MHNIYRLAGISTITLALFACNDDTASSSKNSLESLQQKASYSYGVDIATRLKQQDVGLDISAFNQGISDAYSGAELILDDEARLQAKTSFQAELRDELVKKQNADSAKNIAIGKKFLEENGKKTRGSYYRKWSPI